MENNNQPTRQDELNYRILKRLNDAGGEMPANELMQVIRAEMNAMNWKPHEGYTQ